MTWTRDSAGSGLVMHEHETSLDSEWHASSDSDRRGEGSSSRSVGVEGRRRGLGPRASLAVRRLLGVAIAVLGSYGIYHVVFATDLFAPVLANAASLKEGIDWVVEDPKRSWAALAVLVIPHIGLYYLLFEDQR